MGTTDTGAMGAGKRNGRDFAGPRDVFTWLALGVATFTLSELSLLAPFADEGIALFWLASGLTLGVLVNLPFESWAGAAFTVFLCYLASNLNHSIPVGLAVTVSLANALEAACGAALFSFLSDRFTRSRATEIVLLVSAGAVACSIGAMVGVGALVLSDQVSDIGRSLSLWFVADFLGVVLVAPFIVAWWPGSSQGGAATSPRFRRELGLGIITALVIAYLTFWRDLSATLFTPLLYSGLVLLFVCSLRLGARGTSAVALCIAAMAVSGTLAGHGPFVASTKDVAEQATSLQIYLATMCLAGLIPGLFIAEQQRPTEPSPQSEASDARHRHHENVEGSPESNNSSPSASETASPARRSEALLENFASQPTAPPNPTPSLESGSLEFCVVGDIAAGAAHDFNNFLTAIQGSAQILSFDARDEQKELIQDLLDASAAARRFTSLLTSLKCEDRVRFAEVELEPLLKEAQRTLSRLAGPGFSMNLTFTEGERTVHTDPRQLQHYIFQFAYRARRAVKKGGELSVYVSPDGGSTGSVTIEFTCAVNDRKDQRAFRESLDQCATLHESQKNDSIFTSPSARTRLGASLVVVDGASSTTVRLQLNSKERPFETAVQSAPPPPAFQGTRILVVEDGAELRAPLERLLLRKGFRPQMVSDPEGALNRLKDETFDLVLTDLMMPGMNGQQLREQIHKISPDLPVLFMSGFGDDTLVPRLQGTSGTRLLRKPFTAQELSDAIVAALGARNVRPEQASGRS